MTSLTQARTPATGRARQAFLKKGSETPALAAPECAVREFETPECAVREFETPEFETPAMAALLASRRRAFKR